MLPKEIWLCILPRFRKWSDIYSIMYTNRFFAKLATQLIHENRKNNPPPKINIRNLVEIKNSTDMWGIVGDYLLICNADSLDYKILITRHNKISRKIHTIHPKKKYTDYISVIT